MSNGFVVFPYNGWHQELFRGRITPDDTAWAAALMSQLSDAQWDAAFRAGGYDPEVTRRFKAALKTRLAQARNAQSPLAASAPK